jgi:replicative DNA helicase
MPRPPKNSRRGTDSMLEKLVAQIDARAGGATLLNTVPSGFASLDRVLGEGLRRKDLVVLAGAVGSGKSALGLGMAMRAAAAGAPTLYRPGQGVEGVTELIVAKNRNGPTGFEDLYFYPKLLRFVDMLDAD